MTSKKLTSKSGITIPKDLRVMLGWEPGMSVDLEADRKSVGRERVC